jgi:hypothetical protein
MEYVNNETDYELDLVNIELKLHVESGELYNLAKDLYLHPSKYADVIRTLRQRFGPQSALVDTNKVNIFNPPPHSPTTLLSLPSGTPIYMSGTTNQNQPHSTQSENLGSFPGLLKGVNQGGPVNIRGANPGVAPNITGPSTAGFSSLSQGEKPPLRKRRVNSPLKHLWVYFHK